MLSRGTRLATAVIGVSALAIADMGLAFGQLEEIVVTARKRAEDLQSVPVAIQAFDSSQIARFAATDLSEVADLANQVIINESGVGLGANIRIRGLGSATLDPGIESSVVVNADGVQLDRGHIIRQAFFDLQSVEILKGPQALFYGKNSPGGVIALNSARPGETFESSFKAGYESEAREWLAELILSGPINDWLGARLAYRFSDQDGFYKNVARPQPAPESLALEPFDFPGRASSRAGGSRTHTLRLTLDAAPRDDFDAVLRVTGTQVRHDNFLLLQNVSCTEDQPVTNAHIGAPIFEPEGDCRRNRTLTHGSIPPEIANNQTFSETGRRNGDPFGRYDSVLAGLNLDWELPNVTLSSVTGFYWFDYERYDNSDNTTFWQLGGIQLEDQRVFSQELRALTTLPGRFNFMGGIYFEDMKRDSDNAGKIFPLGADPVTGWFNNWAGQSTVEATAWSAFGQVIFDVRDDLEITAGVRYTDDERDGRQGHIFVHTLAPPIFQPEGEQLVSSFSDTNFSPEATVTWRPTADLMVYGAFRTGYKAGGISTSPVLTLAATEENVVFSSEEAIGGEIGIKSTWLDGRLRINADIYQYDFDDLQVSAFDAGTTAFSIQNAAEARTRGAEIETEYQVNGDLYVWGQLAYNKGTYTDYDTAPCYSGQTEEQGCIDGVQDLTGQSLNFAPRWTGSVGFDWLFPIVEGRLHSNLSAELIYSDSYEAMSTNNPLARQSSFWRTNLRAGIFDPNDRWELAFISRNLFDRRHHGGCADKPGGFPAGQDIQCTTLRGRQLLLQGIVRF